MPSFTVTRRVKSEPRQIFDVIADVAKYREFLPLVERSAVRGGKRVNTDGSEQFSADLVVAYHPLRIEEHFGSEVSVNPENMTVRAVSSGQALKRLVSSWAVIPAGVSESDVVFTVDYEIKGFFLSNIVSGMFDLAVRKIMNAFEERVRSLHTS